MITAGVDLGVRKAAVSILCEEELVTTKAYESSATLRSTQLAEVSSWVQALINLYQADAVYVEEPIAGRSVRVSLQIAQMAGAVLSALDDLHNRDGVLTRSYLVSNTHWKKALLGLGAGKDIKLKVRKWLDTEFPSYASKCDGDQDRYDASCIAIYGERQQLLAARLREGTDVLGAPALPDGQALA